MVIPGNPFRCRKWQRVQKVDKRASGCAGNGFQGLCPPAPGKDVSGRAALIVRITGRYSETVGGCPSPLTVRTLARIDHGRYGGNKGNPGVTPFSRITIRAPLPGGPGTCLLRRILIIFLTENGNVPGTHRSQTTTRLPDPTARFTVARGPGRLRHLKL